MSVDLTPTEVRALRLALRSYLDQSQESDKWERAMVRVLDKIDNPLPRSNPAAKAAADAFHALVSVGDMSAACVEACSLLRPYARKDDR